MSVCRPGFQKGIVGFGITLLSGILVNVLRIIFLATGIAYPDYFMGIDVMQTPWHDLSGLVFLAIGCMPVIYWALLVYNPNPVNAGDPGYNNVLPFRSVGFQFCEYLHLAPFHLLLFSPF